MSATAYARTRDCADGYVQTASPLSLEMGVIASVTSPASRDSYKNR